MPAVRGSGPYGGLQGGFERLMKRAGLTGVTPHTLRHSYASMAGDLGLSEPTIAALLGHAAGTTTSRYIHHLDSVLIAAADRVATAIESYALGYQTPADVTALWNSPSVGRLEENGQAILPRAGELSSEQG